MNIGIFSNFWDGKPNHLPLLSLVEMPYDDSQTFNVKISFLILESILETNTEESIQEGIKLLLENEDWRTHLVATVSLLAIKQSKRENLIDLFWKRLSQGSWVSPQILVALSMCDSFFSSKGKKILTEGFKINYSKLSAVDHHVSRGGIPATISEKKVLAAIDYLLNDSINDSDDNDAGGSIAKNWKERVDELIKQNKLKLGYF